MPVLSPQGDKVAFVARGDKGAQELWVHYLNPIRSRRLEGTDGAMHPFWSPDGNTLGFFAGRKLLTIPAGGGQVATVADAQNPRGASWAPDETIIFTNDVRAPLLRVSARGGAVDATHEAGSKQARHSPLAMVYAGRASFHLSCQPIMPVDVLRILASISGLSIAMTCTLWLPQNRRRSTHRGICCIRCSTRWWPSPLIRWLENYQAKRFPS